MIEQAQSEAAKTNKEIIENVVDKAEESGDNVITDSEELNIVDSVDSVLSDMADKIGRLEGVHRANIEKAEALKNEQKALKLKQKSSEKELKRAKRIAKKMQKLVA